MKSLSLNRKIRLQQKFCLTYNFQMLYWQYLSGSGWCKFFINSFTQISGKSIKSTNTALEVLKRDFSFLGLWRPRSIPISNKSRQKYKKILLINVLLSSNTPKCGTFKFQTESGYLIFLTTVKAKNRKNRQSMQKSA